MTALVNNPKSSECNTGYLKTEGLKYYSGDVLIYKPSKTVYCWQRFTDEEMNSLASLVAEIVHKNNIPFDYKHIIGHDVIAGDKIDPGPAFDWNKFMISTAKIINDKYGMDVKVPIRRPNICMSESKSCSCFERFNIAEDESRGSEKASCSLS
jgi:hypothetical protein